MTVVFSSSGNSEWDGQKSKTFQFSEASSTEIQNEIVNGACNSATDSYSGSIGSSTTQIQFSDERTLTTEVDDKDQIQKQVKESFTLKSGLPLFFYRYNGSVERFERVSSSATTKTIYSAPTVEMMNSTSQLNELYVRTIRIMTMETLLDVVMCYWIQGFRVVF